MNIKQVIAGTALAALLAGLAPAAPVLANGAASTRNIILGAAAATYLIIQHNRKVHERYAQDAQRQAQLSQQANNAWAAYHAEQRAYDQEAVANADLKREVAFQHNVVVQQRHELAMAHLQPSFAISSVAAGTPHSGNRAAANQVAMVSYGWGTL